MISSWNNFIAFSEDGKYYVKSLKDSNLLTTDAIQKMKKEAKVSIGKHYDSVFNWDDKEMYCSEYVWKIYKNTLNLEIGKLKQLQEFDLTHPAVKAKLKERYGNKIPLTENMISPADIYESVLLK